MRLARSVADVRQALAADRQRGARIGLVPTMGALHEGHGSLIAAAREACDTVVVSVFVNPAQFGERADLESYPRDEAHDRGFAEEAGVDLLFAPSEAEIYPDGFDTWIDPGKIATYLEGAARPGHFRGVATVCARLFGIVEPKAAFFGRKDAQQVAVVKQLVRDLALPLEIVACPTARDSDGLAFSSRNQLLSPGERATALALPRALEAGRRAHLAGDDATRAAREVLDAEPGLQVDYVAVADLDGSTLAAAAVVGTTRLIDNVRLSDEGDR